MVTHAIGSFASDAAHPAEATALGAMSVFKPPESAYVRAAASILVQDHLNWTPLHYAATCETQNLEVIEALVAEGADLNALTLEDETPVQLAWKAGHEIPARLLERLARASGRPSLPIRPQPSAGEVTFDGQR